MPAPPTSAVTSFTHTHTHTGNERESNKKSTTRDTPTPVIVVVKTQRRAIDELHTQLQTNNIIRERKANKEALLKKGSPRAIEKDSTKRRRVKARREQASKPNGLACDQGECT